MSSYSTRLFHCVKYADPPPAAIYWLTGALGFDLVARFDTDDGLVAHCQLSWPGGGGVMLVSVDAGSAEITPGAGAAYLVTDDPDGLYRRLTESGARFSRELSDADYGNRELTVFDPEGNQWSVGSYPGEPLP